MTSGPTYTPIQTQTLGSSAGTVSFTSIPQTYTDLVIISQIKNTTAAYLTYLIVNSGNGGLFSGTLLYGNGSSAVSQNYTGDNSYLIDRYPGGTSTTNFAIYETHIMNYSNTTTYKTALSRGNIPDGSGTAVNAGVFLLRNTAAVTTLTFSVGGGQYATGSTFTLYGISAA